jgi:tryptophan-rich sensory protein
MLSAFVIILLFVLAAVIVNIFTYYYGWGKTGMQSDRWNIYQNSLTPPSFTIAFFWLAIFGFLGYSFYLLVRENDGKLTLGSIFVLGYGIFALAYPWFTWKAREKNANVINYIAVILAYVVSLVVITEYTDAFYYLLPLIIWVSYIGLTDSIMYRNLRVRDATKKMTTEMSGTKGSEVAKTA